MPANKMISRIETHDFTRVGLESLILTGMMHLPYVGSLKNTKISGSNFLMQTAQNAVVLFVLEEFVMDSLGKSNPFSDTQKFGSRNLDAYSGYNPKGGAAIPVES
jgi:hypothetical protein